MGLKYGEYTRLGSKYLLFMADFVNKYLVFPGGLIAEYGLYSGPFIVLNEL
jgi:hypothetical protein